MSLNLKLWDPRKPEDIETYNFYDIDEEIVNPKDDTEDIFDEDDGIWGFQTLDNDDPPDYPNNDSFNANFEIGNLDHEETVIADDGIWGFQTLENDDNLPGYRNNDAMEAIFDLGDLDEGVDPDSYIKEFTEIDMEEKKDEPYDPEEPQESFIPDDTDCEFYCIDDFIDAQFDFRDADEVELDQPDRYALEYNFGEEDKNPYYAVPTYFRDVVLRNSLQFLLNDGAIKKPVNIDLDNPVLPYVSFQMFYNIETNKVFMEYNFSSECNKICDRHKLITTINGYIHGNMYDELGYWPEIIMYEDGISEICNSTDKLTPYVIGYWESLSGRMEFIEDRTEIASDMSKFKIIDHGEEYNQRYQEIYRKTKDNFEWMMLEIKNLNEEFGIEPSQTPSKDIKEFLNTVINIRKSYEQTYFTEEQKSNYIKESFEIWNEYHNDMDIYHAKIKELDEKYMVKPDLNKLVPDIYEEFKVAYKEFFDRELPEVFNFVQKFKFRIGKLAAYS